MSLGLGDIFRGGLADARRRVAAWRKQGFLSKDKREETQRRVARLETLEPRLLLSADISAAAIHLADGIQDVGQQIQDFIDDNEALNFPLPIVVRPADALGAEPVTTTVAATLKDLLAFDVQRDGDPALTPFETALDGLDADNDGKVELEEWLGFAFLDKVEDKLRTASTTSASTFANEVANFVDTLDAGLSGSGFTFDIEATGTANADEIFFNVVLELDFTTNLPLDLGTEMEQFGISFPDLSIAINLGLTLDLTFGVFIQDEVTFQDFYVESAELRAEASASTNLTGAGIDIGFLGASVVALPTGNHISLTASIEVDAVDPSSATKLGFGAGQFDAGPQAFIVANNLTNPLGTGRTEFYLQAGRGDTVLVQLASPTADVQAALIAAGFVDTGEETVLATRSLADVGKLRLSIAADGSGELGFTGSDTFSSVGTLTATDEDTVGPLTETVEFLLSVGGALPLFVRATGTDLASIITSLNNPLNSRGLSGHNVTASEVGGRLRLTSTGGASLEIVKGITIDSKISTVDLATPAALIGDVDIDADVDIDIPIAVKAGIQLPSFGLPRIQLLNFDPFSLISLPDFDLPLDSLGNLKFPLDLQFNTDFLNNLLDFNNISVSSFIGLLGQLSEWLVNLSDIDFLDIEIPLSGISFGEIIDFVDTLRDALLYDDADDGVDGDDKLITDINRALDSAGLGGKIYARPVGGRIELVGDDTFEISGSASTLGFAVATPADRQSDIDGTKHSMLATSAVAATASSTFTIQFRGTTYQVTVDGTGNTGLGNDTQKLLDAGNTATFGNAQELAEDLAFLLELDPSIIGARYVNQELLFDLRLSDVFAPEDIPLNFDLEDLGVNLAPLLDLSTESSLRFAADGSLSLTLGVSLRASGSSELLSPTTPLLTLNDGDGVGIKDEVAVTAALAPAQIVGRLTEDASFQIRIDGGPAITANLLASSTSTNTTINDLRTDLQNAIGAPAVSGIIVGVEGKRLKLTTVDTTVNTLEIIADTSNPAVTQLGFQPQVISRAVAEQITVMAGKEAPTLVGRLSNNATFSVQIGSGTPVTVTVLAADTASNVTILDLVDDVNAALAGQIAGGSVTTFVLTDDATFTVTLDSDNNLLDGPVGVTVHAADARLLGFVQNQEGRGTLLANFAAPADGVLAADMTFLLALGDEDPVKFTIQREDTAGFSRADLVSHVNGLLAGNSDTAGVTFAFDETAGKFKFTAGGSTELKILSAGTTQGNANLAALASDVNNALQNALQDALTEHFEDDDGLVPPLLEARASGSSIVFTTVNTVGDNPNAINAYQVVAASGNPAATVLSIPTTAASATNLVADFQVSAAGDKLVITADDSITAFTLDPTNTNAETGLGLGTLNLVGNERDLVIEVQNNAVGANGRFFISLDGAATIGAVIAMIEAQTLGNVDAAISADGTRLVLRDLSVTGAFNGDFHVEATNGSAAALRLGILRADTSNPSQAPDGAIEGATLAGLTLADRFFIENAVASGSFMVSTPTGIQADANFGFVGVGLTGSGSLFGAAEVGFKAPEDSVAGGRITLKQMGDVVADGNVGDLFATPVITGGGDLDLAVSANIAGIDFGSGSGADAPSISIQLDKLGNPLAAVFGSNPVANGVVEGGPATFDLIVNGTTAHVTLTAADTAGNATLKDLAVDLQLAIGAALTAATLPANLLRVDATGNRLFITAVGNVTSLEIDNANPQALGELGVYDGPVNKLPKLDVETHGDFGSLVDFGSIDFADILAAIRALSDFLDDFEAFGFLNDPIPLINVRINDILSFAEDFATAVEELENNPAGTLQLLEAKLHEALGISPDDLDAINLSIAEGNILKLELSYDAAFTTSLPINFDLGAGLPFDLAGAGDIQADGRLDISLDFGIDLDDPLDPDSLVVFDTTGVFGELNIGSDNLAFRAALGPAGIFVAGGEVSLGGTLASAGGSAVDEIFRLNLDLGGEDYKPIADVIADLGEHINAEIGADIHVNLPVFFPTESNERGAVTFDAALEFDDDGVDEDGGFEITGGELGAINVDAEPISLTELFTFDFANASLLDNILLAIDGIDMFLAGLQDVLDGEVFGVSIPLIGDKLSSAADFIADFREDFIGTFREEIEKLTSPGDNIISRELFALLGPAGLGILLDSDDAGTDITAADVVLDTNIDDEGVDFADSFIQWNVRIGGAIVNASAGIGFDLGIPGLGLETEGAIDMQMDWEFEFGFGLSGEDAFYIDISDSSELQLDIEVTLPDAALTGRLAFLQLRAQDAGTRLGLGFAIDIHNSDDDADERLALQELGSIGLGILVAAEAEVHLDLTLGLNADLFPSIAASFPEIVADLVLIWRLGESEFDFDESDGRNHDGYFEDWSTLGNAIMEGLERVAFENVGLDLGSFLTDVLAPIVEEVQKATKPIQPIIEILTTPIPVISDLAGPTTLLDLAGAFSKGRFDIGLIKAVADIITLINAIPIPEEGEDLIITFGDFVILGDGAGSDLDLTNPNTAAGLKNRPTPTGADFDKALASKPASSSKSFTQKLKGGGFGEGFSFPILTDPAQVFGLLMGNEATLIEYDMPALVFDFKYTQFFSIFGPLGVSITGEVSAVIDFAFGYDTAGIKQFIDTDMQNPLLLFNGFFVSDLDDAGNDVAELQFDAGISAAAELNLGVARAGVAGGIFASVDFDLHDPNDDGKLRIYELVTNVLNQAKYGGDLAFLAPLAIFDVHGEVFAKLFAFLKIDLFLFSFSRNFDITPPITLVDFDIPFTRVPTLATEIDGGLQLNIGEFAGERLEGNTSDGNEQIFVKQGSSANKFLVWSDVFGVSESNAQEYTASTRIIANGAAGNDRIDLSGVTADIDFEINGGVGNDIIKLGAASLGAGLVRGGAGDDQIWGGGGADVIYGEQGNDTIHAGGGSDIVFGDSGEVLGQSMTVTFSSKDGNDTINGDAGDDFLFGGGGKDNVNGGANNDIVLGDGGRVYFSSGWVVEDSNKAAGGGADTLSGGSGNDRVFGGKGNDTVNGDAGDDQLFGEDGGDTINGGTENDVIRGGIGDDVINAGAGHDQVYGEDGIDLMHGDAGDDLLRGGRGADTIHGDDGDDDIFGEGEPDIIFGGAGIDEIDGGMGADAIKGGADDDLIIIRSASDTADGEGGGDSYVLTFKGGNSSSLVKLLDTGSVADVDVFVAHGTVFDDEILLRSNTDGSIAFVALINSPTMVERVNYSFMERVIVNGSFGDDYFASDDTAAEVTLNGEAGADTFQIGQMFKSDRGDISDLNGDQFSDVTGVALEDVFATIETTRGFLSNGISAPMTINGGLGADRFVVYHNRAVLQLNGEEGDDVFEVRAFALAGSQEPQRERTDITGGAGADLVQYAVNAPVNINGGDGFDTLVVIGTEFGDDLVITENGVFGAGLNINFVNIESLRVDGAEGDDRFFVKSTSEKFITELFGGLGSDTFNMSGDTPPVVSNDLRGHSGLVLHGVESVDPRFDEQKIFGVSANVADNDEPFAVIRQTDGSTIITEGGPADTYQIVLTRAPEAGKPVFIKVLAPIPTPTDRERRGQSFRVDSLTKVDSSLDGSSITLRFDSTNWSAPQVVQVIADSLQLTDLAGLFTRPEIQGEDTDPVASGIRFDMDDDAFEGARSGVINHLIQSSSASFNGLLQAVNAAAGTVQIAELLTPTDELLGRKLFISEGPGIGQTRFIVGVTDLGTSWRLTLDRAFSGADVPTTASEFFISIDDAYTGRMTSFQEGAFAGGDPIDDQRSIFVDTAGGFPTAGQGLVGAVLEIIGGPGAGQQRLILGHVDGAESTSLILSGPWNVDPVPGLSVYRIERYDGLAIPSVSVEIHDNDRPGVIVDETKAWKNGAVVDDFDTITTAVEGGDGDNRGEIDVLRLMLNKNPGATGATVSLIYDATQVLVTDTAGNTVTSVSFTSGNWNTFKNLLVKATNDTLREGFHSSLIEFSVTAGSLDGTASKTDSFVDVPDDEPVFLVGLSQLPREGGTVTVTIDGVALAADEFQVVNSQVLFLDDDGQPTGRAGTIVVSYQYVVPGFQSAFTAPVLVKLHDDDAPTVIVRETGGTTDVVESTASASASQTQVGNVSAGNVLTFNFASAIPTSGGGILTVSAIADLDWTSEFLTLKAEDQFTTNLFVHGGQQYGLVTTTIHLTANQLTAMAVAGGITFTVTPSHDVNDLSFFYFIQERLTLRLDTFSAPDDSYELVLSGQPTGEVTVTVTPEITKTTRTGGIRHDAVQVALSSGDSRVTVDATGNLLVTFNAENWDDPVLVKVAAIDDQVVDGSDTQVFAPGPNTVSGILGPVFVEGAGGAGSLAMNAPLMLPGETNQRETDGNVLAFQQDSSGGAGTLELMTVETADLTAKLAELGLTSLADLAGLTLEMSEGRGTDVVLDATKPNEKFDRFWLIREVQDVAGDATRKTLVLQNPSQVTAGVLNSADVPNASSKYAITNLSINFFADEESQVDFMFVNDQDSPADSSGVLTATNLSGLNMGPDLVIGGQRRPGGITYNDLEVLEINLGKGNNNFTVLGTHTREDGFQTWTFVNSGDEPVAYNGVQGDTVTVKLNAVDELTRAGTVAAAENPLLANGLRATITIDGLALANGALAGQVIEVLEAGQAPGEGTQRRILGNIGNILTVDRPWETLPTGDAYRIVNEADGAFAVNTQGGHDTIDASGSTLGIVAFGGLGNDTITGGSGDDILFGDRGRVDYFNGTGAIVTRLGDAPAPILGFVTTQVTPATLTQIVDAGAAFPVQDVTIGDGLGSEDIGLRGLFVDINNGKGFLQTPRLITGNTATTLTIAPGFDPLEVLPGPFVSGEDIPSEYRISTMPEDQTDGNVYAPTLVISIDNDNGGTDTVTGGQGRNQIIGGANADTLSGGAAEDVIIGDGGRIDRRLDGTLERAVSIVAQGGDGDTIFALGGFDVVLGGDGGDDIFANAAGVTDESRDVVLGDHGLARFDHQEVLVEIRTVAPGIGGSDSIDVGQGEDFIVGGAAGDFINYDRLGNQIGEDDDRDFIIGDDGYALFDNFAGSSLLREISTIAGNGGDDLIFADEGSDVVLGGDGADDIDAGTEAFRDIAIGDNGLARFDAQERLIEIFTTDETLGGDDDILVGEGDDVVFGGVGSDYVNWNRLTGLRIANDSGRDIVVGDNGKAVFHTASLNLKSIETTDDDQTTDPLGSYDDFIFADEGPDVVLGGNGSDVIDAGTDFADRSRDIVIGDNGRAEYDAEERLIRILTAEQHLGGDDDVTVGNGEDVVFGGVGSDFINWDRTRPGDDGRISNDDARDIFIGDNGRAEFHPGSPLLKQIQTTDAVELERDYDDFIFAAEGSDVVLGGLGADRLDAGIFVYRDIVLGDNGIAFFDAAEILFDIHTTEPTLGGDDDIVLGDGDDVAFGGVGSDYINWLRHPDPADPRGGRIANDSGRDIIVGDNGIALFHAGSPLLQSIRTTDNDETTDPLGDYDDFIYAAEGPDVVLGGNGADVIDAGTDAGDLSRDIVIGDNGAAEYDPLERLIRIATTEQHLGGDDDITVGNGDDVAFGGIGSDFINWDRNDRGDGGRISDDSGRDIFIGDNGLAEFHPGSELLSRIQTTDGAGLGGDYDDWIFAAEGSDVVLGGLGADTLDAGIFAHRDIVLGDNGKVLFDTAERITTIETTDPVDGGSDFIVVGDGDDVVFGGVGKDFINVMRDGVTQVGADSGRDIVLGDNGIATFWANSTRLRVIETTDDDTTDPARAHLYDDAIFAGNGADVVLGGNGADYINAGTDLDGTTDLARDIVIGDNGIAEFDANEVLVHIATTEPHLGGDDDIVVGDGDDVAMGGIGSDYINWVRGGERIADDRGKDVVIGDNGEAWFNAVAGQSQIREITTTDPEHGDDDHIFAAEGQDVVFGGSGDDVIDAGTDPNDLNPDIVIGDNGRATFNGGQVPTAAEASSVLSFNFNGGNEYATVTGEAGKVKVGHWNNLRDDGPRTYGNDAGELLYFDDGKIAPGISIEWGADLDSTHHGDPDDLHEESHSQIDIRSTSTQDQRLFEGYLSADTDETVGVSLTGLDAHFSSYSAYVYIDLDNDDSRSGSSERLIKAILADGTTRYATLDDPDGHTFSGNYEGFYVRFDNLTGDTLDIRIDDDGSSSSNKPGVTAVQIVGTHHRIDRIETIHTAFGGADQITTGSGPDIVFGGEKGDHIVTHGNSIFGEVDADIVAGDNAAATFTVRAATPGSGSLFVLGELREVRTTHFEAAGTAAADDGDTIFTGNGEDVVIGGNGGDFIDTGAAAGSYDYGALDVVSINFSGGVAEGDVTGVAGAVAVDGWHNIAGGKGSATLDGIQVKWGEEKSSWWSGTSLSGSADLDSHDEIDPDTQNERLFEGYIEKDDCRLGVDLAGLGALGTYDVYLYIDSDDADHDRDDPSVVKVSAGGQTHYVNDGEGSSFDGTFVDASSGTAVAPKKGNFVVFRGLTQAELSIRLSGDETLGRHADGRPSISAIQIVSGLGRAHVVLTGDVDNDRVVGDNAVVRWFDGEVYEIATTDLQASASLDDYQSDTITTGGGADIAIGGNGGDDLAGGEGDDLLLGDNARLLLFAGEVIDLCDIDHDDHHHHHHDHSDPYDVLGIELAGAAIGGNDILEGGADDDLIYGQFGNDTYVFAGGGLGQDFLVEAGAEHHHDDDHDHHHHHHHHGHGLLNDLHDMLDFSQFAGGVDINLDYSGQQTINGYRTGGDVNLKLVMFHGDSFEDVIGSAHADRIDGNERDNVLVGLAGDDQLEGDSGDDVLLGNEGCDELEGGWGNDILDGGAGNDELEGGHGYHDDDDDHGGWHKMFHGSDILLGGLGDDRIEGGGGNDLLDGGAGNDCLEGDSGNDILLGGLGDDRLEGDSGYDVLAGGAGKDYLDGGSDADKIHRDATDTVKSDKKDTVAAAGADPDLSAFFVAFNSKFRPGDACGAAGPSIDWALGTNDGWGNRVSPFAGASVRKDHLSPVLFQFSAPLPSQTPGANYDQLGKVLRSSKAAK